MKLEHPLIGMVIQMCVFLTFAKLRKNYDKKLSAKSALESPRVYPRLYPILILNTVLANIFFPLGKMIGMVRL